MESYVHDIFGGATTFEQTLKLKNDIIRSGYVTTAKANLKKCHGPCQELKMLGMVYNAVTETCPLPPEKVDKYISRIDSFLWKENSISKEAEKLVGILDWAKYVKSYGLPFISVISSKIKLLFPPSKIKFNNYDRMALLIWKGILRRNSC